MVRKNDSNWTAYSRSGLLQDAADLGEAYIMLYAATFEKKNQLQCCNHLIRSQIIWAPMNVWIEKWFRKIGAWKYRYWHDLNKAHMRVFNRLLSTRIHFMDINFDFSIEFKPHSKWYTADRIVQKC